MFFVRPLVQPPSICPSRYLLLNWADLPSLATWLTLIVSVCESNIIVPSVHPSVRSLRYFLLNHWVEINQTCNLISPRSNVARAALFFTSLCLAMKAWRFAVACYRLCELVIFIIIITLCKIVQNGKSQIPERACRRSYVAYQWHLNEGQTNHDRCIPYVTLLPDYVKNQGPVVQN